MHHVAAHRYDYLLIFWAKLFPHGELRVPPPRKPRFWIWLCHIANFLKVLHVPPHTHEKGSFRIDKNVAILSHGAALCTNRAHNYITDILCNAISCAKFRRNQFISVEQAPDKQQIFPERDCNTHVYIIELYGISLVYMNDVRCRRQST